MNTNLKEQIEYYLQYYSNDLIISKILKSDSYLNKHLEELYKEYIKIIELNLNNFSNKTVLNLHELSKNFINLKRINFKNINFTSSEDTSSDEDIAMLNLNTKKKYLESAIKNINNNYIYEDNFEKYILNKRVFNFTFKYKCNLPYYLETDINYSSIYQNYDYSYDTTFKNCDLSTLQGDLRRSDNLIQIRSPHLKLKEIYEDEILNLDSFIDVFYFKPICIEDDIIEFKNTFDLYEVRTMFGPRRHLYTEPLYGEIYNLLKEPTLEEISSAYPIKLEDYKKWRNKKIHPKLELEINYRNDKELWFNGLNLIEEINYEEFRNNKIKGILNSIESISNEINIINLIMKEKKRTYFYSFHELYNYCIISKYNYFSYKQLVKEEEKEFGKVRNIIQDIQFNTKENLALLLEEIDEYEYRISQLNFIINYTTLKEDQIYFIKFRKIIYLQLIYEILLIYNDRLCINPIETL